MYIPKHFKGDSYSTSFDFIEAIAFGAVIMGTENDVLVAHLPLYLNFESSGEAYLFGHMAKANPLWKQMTNPNRKVLTIFSSPSAYISAGWYNHLNVPTANYIAVHARGTAQLIEDSDEIILMLGKSIYQHESKPIPRYNIENLPKEFLDREIKSLVAFKIYIEEIESNFKLSQNRDQNDYLNIIHELHLRGNQNDKTIAKYMEKVYMQKNNSFKSDEPVIHFRIAKSEEEMKRVFDSRYSISANLYPFLFTSDRYGHVAKDAFDDISYIFYCESQGEVIASCRATPSIDGKWEISDSLPENFRFDADPKVTVQLNRVYIDERYRRIGLHEKMFYYFSLWVIENTPYKKYFATCNAGLVRLYERLGAELLTQDGLFLKGRLSHKYYIVRGEIIEFNRIAKEIHKL